MLECFLLLVLTTLAAGLVVVVVVVTTHVRGKHLGSTYVLHRYACALSSAKEKQTLSSPAPAVLRVRRPVVARPDHPDWSPVVLGTFILFFPPRSLGRREKKISSTGRSKNLGPSSESCLAQACSVWWGERRLLSF